LRAAFLWDFHQTCLVPTEIIAVWSTFFMLQAGAGGQSDEFEMKIVLLTRQFFGNCCLSGLYTYSIKNTLFLHYSHTQNSML
jgi:hypothetical protein